VWQQIISARDQMVAFINALAQQLPADASTLDYAKMLITAYSTNGDTANEKALQALKNEARTLI
jgi:hypothetical protein